MFCGKCGAQVNDNGKFCPKCGAPLQTGNAGGAGNSDNAPHKRPPYLAIGAIVVIVILAVCLLKSCTGKGYEKPIKTLVKAIEKQDVKKLMDVFPDVVWEAAEEEFDMDKKEMVEYLEDMLEDEMEEIEDRYSIDMEDLEGKYSIDYEIKDVDDCTKKEIRDIMEEYEDELDRDVKIKDAKELELELTVKVDGEKETAEETVRVVKIGRKWYLDISSL